jgi:hypothetical protein
VEKRKGVVVSVHDFVVECKVCKHSKSWVPSSYDDYNFGPICSKCARDSLDLKVSTVEAERIAAAIIEAECTFGGVYNSRVLRLDYEESVFYIVLPHPACNYKYDFRTPYNFCLYSFEDEFGLDAVSTLLVFSKIQEIEEKNAL